MIRWDDFKGNVGVTMIDTGDGNGGGEGPVILLSFATLSSDNSLCRTTVSSLLLVLVLIGFVRRNFLLRRRLIFLGNGARVSRN